MTRDGSTGRDTPFGDGCPDGSKGVMTMRRVTRNVVVLTTLGAAAMLTACAKPPQAEMDAAKLEVERAVTAEAETYAPEELEAAREALRKATAEVEAQGQKFALTRSYESARVMMQEAGTAAETARVAAVNNREAAKAAVADAVEAMTSQITTAEADLAALAACRKAPKGFAQDLELMRGKVDALAGQLAGLESEVEAERYKAASEMAAAIEPEMTAVVTDLSTARTKLGC